jgi:hypothetical protein
MKREILKNKTKKKRKRQKECKVDRRTGRQEERKHANHQFPRLRN